MVTSVLRRFRDAAVLVVAIELVLVAGLGVWSARNEYIQYGDEMVHLSYTKFIADHGRLPQLGKDVVPPEVFELNRAERGGAIDCHPDDPRVAITLCGIYEAFQPPLTTSRPCPCTPSAVPPPSAGRSTVRSS